MAQVSWIATGDAATRWIVRVGDAPGEALALVGTEATDSGTVDAAASSDGTLTRVGSATAPGAVGGEGIVAG